MVIHGVGHDESAFRVDERVPHPGHGIRIPKSTIELFRAIAANYYAGVTNCTPEKPSVRLSCPWERESHSLVARLSRSWDLWQFSRKPINANHNFALLNLCLLIDFYTD